MVRAVFLDALGTLVELEPPWVTLRDRVPAEVTDERLVAAVRAEMSYYREHAHEGRDEASLADLRERCARLVSSELGTELSVDALVDSIRFSPYPDTQPALGALRDRGLHIVVVSNWDVSLSRVLERCGLSALVDDTVTSAGVGARKPEREIFTAALGVAGAASDEVIHVGDTAEEDLAGAAAAGIRALLIDRDGGGDISSLEQIVEHL
jgi:putative hydrolase of the HAD superfamily